jgi:hypothetical protein
MDFGGFNWVLMTIVGVLILAAVMFWARASNKKAGVEDRDTDAATRRVYEEEDREHRGESDNVP